MYNELKLHFTEKHDFFPPPKTIPVTFPGKIFQIKVIVLPFLSVYYLLFKCFYKIEKSLKLFSKKFQKQKFIQ